MEPGPAEGDADPAQKQIFEQFTLKVAPCPLRYAHTWAECPYGHAGERARRRDPRTHNFAVPTIACQSMKQEGRCATGDACSFAHNDFEFWLHPSRYHTALCKQVNCQRRFCFFAHTLEELRPLAPRIGRQAACLPAAGATGSGAQPLPLARNTQPASLSSRAPAAAAPHLPAAAAQQPGGLWADAATSLPVAARGAAPAAPVARGAGLSPPLPAAGGYPAVASPPSAGLRALPAHPGLPAVAAQGPQGSLTALVAQAALAAAARDVSSPPLPVPPQLQEELIGDPLVQAVADQLVLGSLSLQQAASIFAQVLPPPALWQLVQGQQAAGAQRPVLGLAAQQAVAGAAELPGQRTGQVPHAEAAAPPQALLVQGPVVLQPAGALAPPPVEQVAALLRQLALARSAQPPAQHPGSAADTPPPPQLWHDRPQ